MKPARVPDLDPARTVNVETGEIVPSLASCEEVIERGIGTFVDVGNALLTIRDAKLYRGEYDTFDIYCKTRWGFARAHAHRLMESAEVLGILSPMGDIPAPTNERQARPLAAIKSEPALVEEAWKEATADEAKPTAKTVEAAVAKVVDREIARREQKQEDATALRKLASDAAKAGMDMDEERQAQRGSFARLCRDLAALPRGSAFLDYHAGYLRDRHRKGAELAHAWLTELLDMWEAPE